MLGWIKYVFEWLANPRWGEAESRRIFTFWDGQRECQVDPLEVWRDLQNDPQFSIDRTPPLVDAGDLEAIGITAAAVRKAFDVKPFAEGGLTEHECLAVLSDFFDFVGSLKKSTDPTPTSPPPTESPSLADSTTPAAADSSSTPIAPSSVSPPASLSDA